MDGRSVLYPLFPKKKSYLISSTRSHLLLRPRSRRSPWKHGYSPNNRPQRERREHLHARVRHLRTRRHCSRRAIQLRYRSEREEYVYG